MDDAALHGLTGEIVRTIEPHSEADPAALLVQFLAAFGCAVGRGPYFRAEGDEHRANIFTAIVGATAKGRKGTSWGRVREFFRRADDRWTLDCIADGLSSGEGLIHHVRDSGAEVSGQEIADKRLLVQAGEFAQVLKTMQRRGNTLSPVVRAAWDGGRLQVMTRRSPIRATGAHVALVGHITIEELRRELKATEAANGFANRFLFVAARRSKVLPDGGDLSDAQLAPLADQLASALRSASNVRELKRDDEARTLWHKVYAELSEGRPGLLGHVLARAEAQVARLAMLYALLDGAAAISSVHLEAALAVWDYCARSAAYVFGESLGDPLADRLLAALRGAPRGLTRTQIRDLQQRHSTAAEVDATLGELERRGLAAWQEERTGGRSATRWRACDRSDESGQTADDLRSLRSHRSQLDHTAGDEPR
jgi:hypothetical protein